MTKIKLTKEEQKIEDELDQYVPASPAAKKRLNQAIAKAKKDKMISLRLRDQDVYQIKLMAENEGVPYQTLINSILHKYITHQLIDKTEAKKMFDVMHDKD